jgi:hypothetical protein
VIFSMLAPPVIEEIHERLRDDALEFGIFRDATNKPLPLKLNPRFASILKPFSFSTFSGTTPSRP